MKNEKKYAPGARLSVHLREEDKLIIDFLNNQKNASSSIREILLAHISKNGVENVAVDTPWLPSQAEIQAVITNLLIPKGSTLEYPGIYDTIATLLAISDEALTLQSDTTGENVYKKRVRFAVLALKKANVVYNVSKGVITRVTH